LKHRKQGNFKQKLQNSGISARERGKVMKKIVLILTIILSVLGGVTSHAMVSLDILGPKTYIRGTGSPITQVSPFSSDFEGPAVIKLTNGSLENSSIEMVSSSIVKLNSQIIFGPSEFNQNVRTLEKQILLKNPANTLEVELRGKPGGQITIQIIQPITNVRVRPQTVALGDVGSSLALKVLGNLSNGTEVDITSPSFGTAYSSANPSVATVTYGGLVTAVAYGQTTVTVTNDDFLGNVAVAVRGTSPVLSDLLLSRTLLPIPREHEQFILTLMFNFSDPNLDIQSFNFSLTRPSSVIQSSSNAMTYDQPTGSSSRKFIIDSSFEEGSYQVGIEIIDAMGNSSGIQTVSLNIADDLSVPRLLEISGIEPVSGKSGDRVVINGIGFEAVPQANSVSFESALKRAEVLSVNGTQLEVIVPEGARTGNIRLMTSRGRTDSPEPFTIIPTISLAPTSTQLLTGASADFSCVPSGTDTYNIIWSINGQTTPDTSLGAIDNRGHFTAPSSLPPVNTLTLRCTSADVQTLYAEASITVVAPAPMPGQALIKASIGGQMRSTGGDVTINIPPGSMATDTVISVELVDPASLPAPTEDSYNLAAVKLEPSGLQFSQPVTVVFSLRSWQEPGTILNVFLANGTGGATDTGKTATVDETGIKAVAAIEHFSTYFLILQMSPVQLQVNMYFQAHASDIIPYFNDFSIYTSIERPLLEGLTVPIVMKRAAGSGPGLGPFLAYGFSINGIIPSTNTQLGLGVVQPSADGWELGTQVSIPVLPGCHEGQTANANLVIGFKNLGISETITIPFAVTCLSELSFSRWSPPEHVPEGAWVDGPADDGTVTVNISTGTAYRFSQLSIGEQGILKVNHTQGTEPAVVEVTGNVSVSGKINITGEKGTPGIDGDDHYDGLSHHVIGGSGGSGGFPNGGDGGSGGPWSGTTTAGCLNLENPNRDCVATCGDLNTSGLWPTTCPEGYTCICYADYGFSTSDCAPLCGYGHVFYVNNSKEGGVGSNGSPGPGGGVGGSGGLLWEAGSWTSLLVDLYSFVMDVAEIAASGGTAYIAYVEAIRDGWEIFQEGEKIWDNEKNKLRSFGWGGGGPSEYASDLAQFMIPLGGGGGGGAGKMEIESYPDKAGGGGGGGGGGAPSLKLITAGAVHIAGGFIDGRGGNGGHGGDGSGGWQGQAAPGGGGGGGNGAQIFVIGNMQNQGSINLKGGVGGASGRMSDERDDPCIYIRKAFGEPGKNGVLRVDGYFLGSSPRYAGLHRGPQWYNPQTAFKRTSGLSELVFLGDQGGWQSLWFNLQQGLNVLNIGDLALHPWQNKFAFYYFLPDSDRDGLFDAVETILGTNPNNPDSDGDGLPDGEEVYRYGTDPFKQDTDGDGYSDAYEIAEGSDPKNPASLPFYSLNVAKAGAGSGSVSSSPSPGLDCGSTCQATYPIRSWVTLHASPSPGSYFAGWSGGGCSGINTLCKVYFVSPTTVVANFELQKVLTVTIEGVGTGWVESTPVGMRCEGTTCVGTYTPGTNVTLNAKASRGSQFAGWSGTGCSGTDRLCTLTISEDMTVAANFEIRPATSMTTPRWDHTATLLSNGKVLITGGADEDFNRLSWAEIYDPATGTFSPTGSMGLSRVGHTATLLRNGKVMVTGGDPGSGLGLASAEFYDPVTGTFSAPQLMMGSRRYWHTSTFLPNGRVIIIGGSPMDDLPEYYDGSTFNLKYSASCLDPHRNRHTATLLPNGKVLLAGGDGPLSSADLYDDSNPCPSLYNPAEMSTPRDGHTATLLPHGNVLIAGGFDGMGTSSTAELYDTNRGIFTPAMSIKVPRDSHTATLLPNGRVLIAGGWGNSEVHSSAELYGGGVFGFTGSMMAPRAGHTATLLQNGTVLLVGGYSINDAILSSAEIYDPETGTFSPPIPSDDYIDLSVSKAGAGSGVVTSTPSGLDCGPTCQATYIHDSYVILQATPSPGSYFGGWSGGGCSGPNPSCTVHLVTAMTVIANFELEKTLTVVKEGAGRGVITSSPSGIDCGSTCQATFPPAVTLQASPLPGSYFAGWSGGGCSGNNPWCIITMAADTTVVANFEPQKTLMVTKTGAGSGVVTSTPSGIDCGSTCQATFTPDWMVTLHAVASPGFYFTGWSGGGCSENATICTVTIAADTTVTANFEIPVPGTLMTAGRKNHTATLLPDGKVLVAGGWDSSDNILPSAELYDPVTGTFTPTGSMGPGRVGHTATLLPNGKVLLAGGEESNNPASCSSAELYDPTTGTVNWANDMVGTHAWHTATYLPGTGWPYGTVLLTGGFAIPDYCDSVAELYNPDLDFFNTPENPYMTSERAGHTATFLQNGKVLIAGGYDSDGWILSSAEIFDPTDPEGFFVTGSMQTEKAWHTATLLPDGKVLVVGGSVIDFGILSSAELYDPATGMFSFAGDMTAARAGHTATLLNNGKALIAGGHGYYDEGVWSSAELYDPATGTFTTTGSMTTPRTDHTATLLNNGKVLLVGGYNDIDGVLPSAEIYDPETGTFTSTAPSDNYGLTVSKAGTGSGVVTSTPSGVDCGPTCQASFPSGTAVTLQAVASAGSYFAGWSGAGCSGTDPCTVTLSANTSVVATFQILSVSVVGDAEGDLLLRNCDPANPTFYCSLPPGAPLSLPGYFNIKTARIEQINGGEVDLSISLYEPVPAAPEYPFLSYSWTFHGGCVNPSPGNKAGIVIYWNGTTSSWTAKWVIIENCTPQTVALGDPVPFEFTADGVKVRVALTEIQTAIDPGEPLFWHASVSRMSVSNGTFPNVVPVDFAPNVMAFNPAPYSTFVYPKNDATWGQGQDIIVPDASGDLLLRICDSANPTFYCSLPPGEQLPLPGWLDIKSARIVQINASQVELSIALQGPIPQTPPSTYLFVDYFWQFEGGCVQPASGNKSGITVIWRDWGSGAEWRANWIEITSCNPFTTEIGGSVPFQFTADGVKVQVALSDLLTAAEPGKPLLWFGGVRRLPINVPPFINTVGVDYAPDIIAFYPTFIYPEPEATWEPN
jgi:hypothetical protein